MVLGTTPTGSDLFRELSLDLLLLADDTVEILCMSKLLLLLMGARGGGMSLGSALNEFCNLTTGG